MNTLKTLDLKSVSATCLQGNMLTGVYSTMSRLMLFSNVVLCMTSFTIKFLKSIWLMIAE